MQTTIKLIGFPSAGSRFVQSSTYHLVRDGYAVGFDTRRGDITGNQGKAIGTGVGAGRGTSTVFQVVGVFSRGPRKGQLKRKLLSKRRGWQGRARGRLATGARAVGIGEDAATARARALGEWLRPVIESEGEPVLDLDKAAIRAAIMAEVKACHSWGERVQAIAKRAAYKQARRLCDRRSVQASATSIEDAAADGVLGILSRFRNLDRLKDEQWASLPCLRALGIVAARAAFRSLASWSVVGMTGDNTAKRGSQRHFTLAIVLPGERSAWGTIAADLVGEYLADRPCDESSNPARRAFIQWVFEVGYHPVRAAARGKGSAAAIRWARSRCLVVANIIQGQSLADACFHSGFGSVKAFIRSCKDARFFEGLKAARARASLDCGAVESARIAQRRYALGAAWAIKRLRFLNAWQWDCERLGTAPKFGGAGVVAVRRLMDWRAHCLTMAKHYKAVASRAMADNLRLFDQVMRGCHSEQFGNLNPLGNLRRVFGLVNKRGAVRGASKINPGMIRRARGKVSRKVKLAATVALPVGRGNRALPCGTATDTQPRLDGPQGFILQRQPAAR